MTVLRRYGVPVPFFMTTKNQKSWALLNFSVLTILLIFQLGAGLELIFLQKNLPMSCIEICKCKDKMEFLV